MSTVRAFVPAHISCIFRPYLTGRPETSSSLGLGFTVSKGLHVKAEPATQLKVIFNRQEIRLAVVEKVAARLNAKARLTIKSSLPLGAGFGMSGAAAFGAGLVLNKLCDLGYTREELGQTAHAVEVEERTGLADVVGQFYGGVTLRQARTPFEVERISVTPRRLYYKNWGKLNTAKILSDQALRQRIDRAARRGMNDIAALERRDFRTLLDLSFNFALSSGLLEERNAKPVILSIIERGGHATMGMLGDSVLSTVPFKGAQSFELSNNRGCLL